MMCKNCGAAAAANYCPGCGQKRHAERVSLRYLSTELVHLLTEADKGIFFLIKELAYRPGLVAKEYLEGRRATYFNPLSFLLIVSAISAYVTLETGYYAALNSGLSQHSGSGIQREVSNIVINHGKLLSLMLIVPVRSFFTWVFFRRKGYNLAENLVFNALVGGETSLILLFFSVPWFLLAPQMVSLNNWIFQGILALYMAMAYRQFFAVSKVHALLKALLIHFLFIIFYWLLIYVFVLARQQVSAFL